MINSLRISKESWKPKIPYLRKLSLMVMILFLSIISIATAQETNVSGQVLDSGGSPIPGVNILEKGTGNGTVTDLDGNFNLNVGSPETTLIFSFIGYQSQEVPLNGRSILNITLEEDVESLDEVIVVGYGAQKERDLTTAISTVKTEDLVKTPTPNAMQSLQGRVAGVQIVSSGAPGASPTVRVRGIGSFEGGGAPLYVVDGMFFENIDFLNPADIKTISVLKDASAAAIYGIRAANGVILVETNSGNYEQTPEIVYNGYYGVQNPQNVLKMANAQQFVQYIEETGSTADMSFIQNAMQRYGRSRVDPSLPNVNTDWYAEVMNPAPIQNHSLSFNGGNAKTRYSLGGSYFFQEGLQNEIKNNYERLNLRASIDTDINDWLTVGGTFNYSRATQFNGEDAAWFSSYFAVPILPVYDELNTTAAPIQLANAQNLGYRGTQNPFFPLYYNDNRNEISKLMGNFHADVHLIPDKLSFHTAYNYKFSQINTRNVNFPFNNGVSNPSQSSIYRKSTTRYDQIVDNYLTYKNFWGAHGLTLTGGQSFISEVRENLYAEGTNLSPDPTWDNEYLWYLSNSTNFNLNNIGDDNNDNPSFKRYYLSVFGRVAYNYDERYLVYGTYRRDGTNKFTKKGANFSTFGVGWVLSEEDFFDVEGINFLKFRASWGQLGNSGIPQAIGVPTLVDNNLAINDGRVIGKKLDPVFDLVDRWETTVEKNFGINAKFFNNRLSLDADYYIRDTKNLSVPIPQPGFAGTAKRSTGEIRNKGLEVALSWNDQISDDFSYYIGGNIATLKNSVTSLGGPEYLDAGSAEFRQRSILGQPYQAFYGYEVEGVFQNEAQITNMYTQEFITENNLQPGDLIFKDQNGDGVVDAENDRVVLGSYLPKLTYGANLGFQYKNLEFSALIQGQSDYSILNRKRGEMIFTNDTNIDADLATNLWRGDGSSNKYPSASGLRRAWNQQMSGYFVEDGSYFRIQNVQLSYSLLNKQLWGQNMPSARITLTAERPLTVFKYNGFNPEVADGIDRQTYPIPAVYTLGLNLKF